MSYEKAREFSTHLPSIFRSLNDLLQDLVGERVVFMLVVDVDSTIQYGSNGNREDCVKVLEGLLARMKAGEPDIPAHANPELGKQH